LQGAEGRQEFPTFGACAHQTPVEMAGFRSRQAQEVSPQGTEQFGVESRRNAKARFVCYCQKLEAVIFASLCQSDLVEIKRDWHAGVAVSPPSA
jgi:hypothetical protein